MNMKPIEYISQYYPYEIKGLVDNEECLVASIEWDKLGIISVEHNQYGQCQIDEFKPLLIPLDKCLDVESGLGLCYRSDMLSILVDDLLKDKISIDSVPFGVVKILLRNHVDIFGLISQGNALNKLDF